MCVCGVSVLLPELSVSKKKKVAVYYVNIIDIAFIHQHRLQPFSRVAAVCTGNRVAGGSMCCIYSAKE